MNETWGISGPAFLLGYGVLAVVVLVLALRARRAVVATPTRGPVGDVGARPHDVAYLNGGPDLAVLSALTALRLRGAITVTRGTAAAVRGVSPGPDELERALYSAATTPTNRRRLPQDRGVAGALAQARDRLQRAGLLLTDGQRSRVRLAGGWMAAVAGLGVLRLVAGVSGGKPVGFLVPVLIVVTVVAIVLVRRAPQRTRAGDAVLAELRERHHELAPTEAPDWRVYGPAGAALGIGMFGAAALWASDPAIAGELAVQRATAVSGSGGSDGGSSCGGSSSSCGGGGGCGGGGCGGGGCGG